MERRTRTQVMAGVLAVLLVGAAAYADGGLAAAQHLGGVERARSADPRCPSSASVSSELVPFFRKGSARIRSLSLKVNKGVFMAESKPEGSGSQRLFFQIQRACE